MYSALFRHNGSMENQITVLYTVAITQNIATTTVIKHCCGCFGFKLPSELLEIRFKKFMFKRSFLPHTRLFYDTLCTYSIIVGFF